MENTTAARTKPLPAADNPGGPGNPGELDERQARQIQHLRQAARETRTQPPGCLHHRCPACAGTGTSNDGSRCIHQTHCACGRCAPKR